MKKKKMVILKKMRERGVLVVKKKKMIILKIMKERNKLIMKKIMERKK